MNIVDVKAVISKSAGFQIGSLDIHAQEENGVVDPNWVSAWFNTERVRITMHKEVFDKIVSDRAFSGLAVKGPEVVTPTTGKAPYTRYVVITPKSILATL
jgi:hypothetical protein